MRTRRLVWLGLVVWAVAVAVGCDGGSGSAGSDGAEEMSQRTLMNEAPEAVVVLDVRTPDEYAAGHVPNATNIPHDQLADRIGELGSDKSRDVVVYCKSGRRAGLAAETLAEAGFTRIHHLTGDMDGWRAAGLPVE
ncbi:MAG: rhodanese-like domain-containing protein [Myxococcota bacterium]